MRSPSSSKPEGKPLPARPGSAGSSSLRRFATLRWIVIAVQLAAVAAAELWLGIRLPWLPMLLVVGLLAGFNMLTLRRLRRSGSVQDLELLFQVCVDLAALTVLIFMAGGVTNPLISLYLPIIAVAATALPPRDAAIAAALSISGYTLLTELYLPLRVEDDLGAVRLHLIGMWLTFVLSAVIMSWFVIRMMQAIRMRDAQLGAAREQVLRNERVVALGNLAAGAAHELGTPLGTMAIIAGEMLGRPGLDEGMRADLTLLRDQVVQCKHIITGLSARAGGSRAEGGQATSLDAWLESMVQRWRRQRPMVEPRVRLEGPSPAPRIIAEATVEQALLNLFNNAADASPADVDIHASWDANTLRLEVADRGLGIAPDVSTRLGREPVTTRESGAGLGVVLAHAAIERNGGEISFVSREGNGTIARVCLPLDALTID
jgi:two-component system sensor histidine kinase RegB